MTTSVPLVPRPPPTGLEIAIADAEQYLRFKKLEDAVLALFPAAEIEYEERKIAFNEGRCTWEDLEQLRRAVERMRLKRDRIAIRSATET